MVTRIRSYAKKSFLALTNPVQSVRKVFPNQLDFITEESGFYLGVKEAEAISPTFIASLAELGYYQHTIDKASLAGRGIDFDLKNPITGRYMTGSSSGTALNVFLGINDLGVGTDGGGSVLGPAMSLNLYSFIHPELGKSYQTKTHEKVSTDGLAFSPSLGFIARELGVMTDLISALFPLELETNSEIKICLDEELLTLRSRLSTINSTLKTSSFKNKYVAERGELIAELTGLLGEHDVVISLEGPVDLNGIGDTIFGHFDAETKARQIEAKKGFIRVINMTGAIALTIPTGELGKAYVLISKNTAGALSQLLIVAQLLETEEDLLIKHYFGNLNNYFLNGI